MRKFLASKYNIESKEYDYLKAKNRAKKVRLIR